MTDAMKRLQGELTRDHINKIVYAVLGPAEGYLVGGFLRDALMQRRGADRDYVVRGDIGPMVDRIAAITGGRSFSLGRYGLLRIILPDGATLDFTPLRSGLKEDLMGRDFCMNALAWSPREGLIDHVGGVEDIKRRVIRAISDKSIPEDPVRIVRAFRFSQELGFSMDDKTLGMMVQYAGQIEGVARERVTSEFIRILNWKDPCSTLEMMCQKQVLKRLILFNNTELQAKIKAISNFQQMVNVLPVKYNFRLKGVISQGLTRLALIRLAILLGRGNEHRLSLSCAILSRLRNIQRAAGIYTLDISLERLSDLFESAGDATPDFLIMIGRIELISEYGRFEELRGRPLLTAEEVQQATGLLPGPKLGKVIRKLRGLEFSGAIAEKEEARRVALDLAISRI